MGKVRTKPPIETPKEVPECGFYYHYKHDSDGPFDQYAYEVLGVGYHTEDNCIPEDQYMVIYRPLYDEEGGAYRAGKLFFLRPLRMFLEWITKDGHTFPRFKRIGDDELLEKLKAKRAAMYGG